MDLFVKLSKYFLRGDKMKNMFNLNGANCSNGSGMVAKLTANDIKEFVEKVYYVDVISIERVKSRIENFINFPRYFLQHVRHLPTHVTKNV